MPSSIPEYKYHGVELCNLDGETLDVLMLEQFRTIIPRIEVFQKGLHVCSTLAVVLFPDSPTPLTSAAMGTSHRQSPGRSASLLVTEETLGNM
jgi:hypothetical protein